MTPGFLQLRGYADATAGAYEQYLVGLTVTYLGIILGFIIGRRVFRVTMRWTESYISHDNEHLMWLFIFSVALIILMVIVQGAGLPVTLEYVKYFIGVSEYNYTQIRRVIFEGHLYTIVSELLRYSITALIYSGWVYFIVYGRRIHVKLLSIVGLFIVFIVAGMQLNKYPFVYFIAIIVLVVLYSKQNRGALLIGPRFYAYSFLAFISALILVYLLYMIQYMELLLNNDLSFNELFEILVYRVFFASNDALRLWFDAFPSVVGYLGIENIGLFRHFGADYTNVTVLIPELYLGEVLTSFQAGFIGSAYAGFGILGIIIVSILVGILVSYCDFFSATRRTRFGKVVVASVLSLNLISLTSREFHTALLSGGVLSAIMVASVGGALGVLVRTTMWGGAQARGVHPVNSIAEVK